MLAPQLRYKDGLWPFSLALSYGMIGYACGLVLLNMPHIAINILGIVLLAHAMVICAYLIHECAHNTIFFVNLHNARLGACLSWITGSCYARYEDIRRKHFRHHVERADVIGFDYRRRLNFYPRLSRFITILEWAYIPAVEIMLHALVIVLPFRNEHYKPQRKRVLSVLVIRAMLFTTLLWLSLRAFLLYPLAYILFLIVLRFMDANQHSYDLVEMHDDTPSPGSDLRDSEYEYRNTYSNLISTRIPLLNLITLNFAYHNAHHARPTVAWYRLPGLHRELYGDDRSHILSFRALLGAYHKHRVARAFWPVAKNLNTQTSQSLDLLGIVGISFLIPV